MTKRKLLKKIKRLEKIVKSSQIILQSPSVAEISYRICVEGESLKIYRRNTDVSVNEEELEIYSPTT